MLGLNIRKTIVVVVGTLMVAAMLLLLFPVINDGIVREKYMEQAPLWVSDKRLVSDAVDNYFSWGDGQGVWKDKDVVIYSTEDIYRREKYYRCVAQLQYIDGQFTLRLSPSPWEAREECFRWAEGLKFRVYRGTIAIEGDARKVIRMERDRVFRHQIVLVSSE